MSSSFRSLLPLFLRERDAGRALVLATVARTEGPTYTKAGALMLIAQSGEYAGLLSGGCLEGDLAEHGRQVLADGQAKLVRYDMHGPDDLVFGLGSGCEGAMDILLQRLDATTGWEPMARLAAAWQARRCESVMLIVRSEDHSLPAGGGIFCSDATSFGGITPAALTSLAARHAGESESRFIPHALPGIDMLRLALAPAARVLLLGAGPDALPVAQLASFLGWNLTVIDHRPHYARPERFPEAEIVLDGGPDALTELLVDPQRTASFAAAIVMSHHFLSDRGYLMTLASSDIPYVGLLGPVVRRERLLSQMGALSSRLRGRLCSPVGLDLGANNPESIALAIAAEIQGSLGGRERIEPLSRQLEPRGQAVTSESLSDPLSS
jgi:xanthine/CO dehydrogenase XdhC/CoxF family maturation factor